jgi:hypothetical protein
MAMFKALMFSAQACSPGPVPHPAAEHLSAERIDSLLRLSVCHVTTVKKNLLHTQRRAVLRTHFSPLVRTRLLCANSDGGFIVGIGTTSNNQAPREIVDSKRKKLAVRAASSVIIADVPSKVRSRRPPSLWEIVPD